MSARTRDAFLHGLVQAVRPQLETTGLEVIGPDVAIEWPGELRQLWPKADILMSAAKSGTQFIIEYDEDSDAGRSIIKYWPYIDKYKSIRIIYIGIWKSGQTYGEGFFKLALFIGEEFSKLYPSFSCHFIRRSTETVEEIARKIQEIVQARKDI